MILVSKARGSLTSFLLGFVVMGAFWAWHDAYMRQHPNFEVVSYTPNAYHVFFRAHGEDYAAVLPILDGLSGYSVPVFIWQRDKNSGPSEPDVVYASMDYMPDCVYISRLENAPPGVESIRPSPKK